MSRTTGYRHRHREGSFAGALRVGAEGALRDRSAADRVCCTRIALPANRDPHPLCPSRQPWRPCHRPLRSQTMAGLERAVEKDLRSQQVELMPYGPVENFEQRLAEAVAYVWLPTTTQRRPTRSPHWRAGPTAAGGATRSTCTGWRGPSTWRAVRPSIRRTWTSDTLRPPIRIRSTCCRTWTV